MNMFEYASRSKLRFETNKGQITTEDLWDLPLTSTRGVSLDSIAISVNKQLQEQKTESFVANTSTNTVLETKLEILKHVIASKQAENEAKRTAAVKASQKKAINDIIEAKKHQELQGKSVEELEAMIAEL